MVHNVADELLLFHCGINLRRQTCVIECERSSHRKDLGLGTVESSYMSPEWTEQREVKC